jgi:hypothetical protein
VSPTENAVVCLFSLVDEVSLADRGVVVSLQPAIKTNATMMVNSSSVMYRPAQAQ